MDSQMIKTFKYDSRSRCLKLFYHSGNGVIFRSVPKIIHERLLRTANKDAFIHKYLEYDLNYTKLYML